MHPLTLVCFCITVRGFSMALATGKQNDMIDAFNSTSRYLGGLLGIGGIFFERVVH